MIEEPAVFPWPPDTFIAGSVPVREAEKRVDRSEMQPPIDLEAWREIDTIGESEPVCKGGVRGVLQFRIASQPAKNTGGAAVLPVWSYIIGRIADRGPEIVEYDYGLTAPAKIRQVQEQIVRISASTAYLLRDYCPGSRSLGVDEAETLEKGHREMPTLDRPSAVYDDHGPRIPADLEIPTTPRPGQELHPPPLSAM